jgi:hypothetical protein
LTPEPSEVQTAEIVAIYQYHTFVGIVNSKNELNQGGLSTAGLSKHYVVSHFELNIQIFDDFFALVLGI